MISDSVLNFIQLNSVPVNIKYASSLGKGFEVSRSQGFLLQRIDQSLDHPLHFPCQLKYLLKCILSNII